MREWVRRRGYGLAWGLIDSPGRYVTLPILIAEGFILFILFAVALALLGLPLRLDTVIETVVVLLLIQTITIVNVRLTPGYVRYLARLCSMPSEIPSTDFRENLVYLTSSLNGIRRLGNFLSKGHFEDIVLMRLSSGQDENAPTELDNVIDAIELDVAVKATNANREKLLVPFSQYCSSIDESLSSNAPTVASLAECLVGMYKAVPPTIAKRAEKSHHERMSLVDWLEKHPQLTGLMTWLLVVIAIVLLAVVFEISVPAIP